MSPSRSLPYLLPIMFGAYTLEFGTISLLPLVANRLNVTVSFGGVFMALFTLAVAISGPILTLFSSQANRRNFLTCALFVLAAGNLFSAYASDISSLMMARLIPALIHPMLFPTVFALAISLYPKKRKIFVISLGVFGAISGLMLSLPLTKLLESQFSYTSSFLFFAALNVFTATLLIWKAPSKPTYSSLRKKIRDREPTVSTSTHRRRQFSHHNRSSSTSPPLPVMTSRIEPTHREAHERHHANGKINAVRDSLPEKVP